jgi:DNA-binding winged helix-turn-helix (wHTH) protein
MARQPTPSIRRRRVGRPREKRVIYLFGDYQIETTRFELSRDGRALPVEPQVLDLLIMLIEHCDRVVSKDELFETIWKGRVVSDTTLSSRIKTARQAIGDDGNRQAYIKTVHGRGFRFVGTVRTRDSAAASKPAERRAASQTDRPVTRYARSDDVHVAYQLFGDGPVDLVLTPGFVSHIDNYWDDPHLARWLHRLGALARVAIFDKRGTGLSDRVGALPGMDERMDDVRAVMDAVRFDTAFIMGISEGGSLATVFAAHHPERCRGLILYGSFARFEYWFADDASLAALFDYIETDWGSGKSLPGFAPSMAGDAAFEQWWGKFERLGATPGSAIALMRMNSQIDISAVLPSLHVRTLVIHRADDVLIRVQGGRELARRIAGAEYVELPGRDHLPWVGDNSGEIVEAIERFLEGMQRPADTGRVLATVVLIQLGEKEGESFVREELQRFRARRIEALPPGIAGTFDGPARALECAVSMSRTLSGRGVVHRIGIHTGEISIEAAALQGMTVDIASCVTDHAADNAILVSRTVNDLVAGSGVALEDRGEFDLPVLNERWHLYQAAAS